MLRAFSLLLLMLSNATWACAPRTRIVSLSAPITGVLRELGLLSSPQLVAVSLFHPLREEEFAGQRLGGGLYLSKREMTKFQDAVVFFDQSDELSRRLRELPFKQQIEVPTRGLDPFEVSDLALKALAPVLQDCAVSMAQFQSWLAREKAFLNERGAFPWELFFFLGEIRGDKLPPLMIVRDGPVLFWLSHAKLKTLQSDLSYVSWGEKWKNGLKGAERFVGLVQAKPTDTFRIERLGPNHFNIHDPMVLSPGSWQIHFMRRFVEQFK